jgi:hypothetical protein
MPDDQNNRDHDLLIRLDQKVDALSTDIKDLKDGTAATINDHELRLRFLEKYQARIVGALGVVNLILVVFELYLKLHH